LFISKIIQVSLNNLYDGRDRTLAEIGERFSLSRESIRQIEAKSLRKLRNPNKIQKLRDYLD